MSIQLRRKPLLALVAVVAVGALVFFGPGEDLSASNNRVNALVGLCESPVGLNRKAMAIEALCEIDSTASRRALQRLADSDDVRTATMALAAIGREDASGGKAKLEAIFEDTDKPTAIRAAAMTAWCCAEKDSGAIWSDVRSYVEDEADGDDDLEAAVAATKARLWQSGGGQ